MPHGADVEAVAPEQSDSTAMPMPAYGTTCRNIRQKMT